MIATRPDRWRRFGLLALAACTTLAAGADAQSHEPTSLSVGDVVDELPWEFSEQSAEESLWRLAVADGADLWVPSAIDERFSKELARGDFLSVLRSLRDDLPAAELPSDVESSVRVQVGRIVEALRAHSVDRLEESGTAITTLAERAAAHQYLVDRNLGKQSMLPQLLPIDEFTNALFFFEGGDDAIAPVLVGDDDALTLSLSSRDMRVLRGVCLGFSHVLARMLAPLEDAQYDELVKADAAWRNYLFEGYSQYPWESYLNGVLLDPKPLEPPTSQWILLHPSVGYSLSTVSLDEIRADQVLNVELLGWLRYRDDNTEYLGGSLTASFRDDVGPGLGLTAHWTGRFSLGVAWHDIDDDGQYLDDDPFVFVTLDLYSLLEARRPGLQETYQRLADTLARY